MRHIERFAAVGLFLSACSTQMTADDTGADTVTGDGNAATDVSSPSDASDAADASDTSVACVPVVSLTSPSQDTIYVRSSVPVQATVQGCDVHELALRVDGEILANLPPPFQYTWDTSLTAEGSHQLVAEAVVAGATTQSAMRTVIVDRTPPSIVRRTPMPDDANVSVREPIVTVFSEPIASATVTAATVRLSAASAGSLAATLRLSPDGTTLTAMLDTAPVAPATATATFASGITDLAGNALVVDSSTSWSWAYPSWIALGGEIRRYTSRHNALDPVIAVDADDTLRVAMVDRDDTGLNVMVVQRWDGTAWQADGSAYSRSSATNTRTPAFARTTTGASVLSWVADDSTSTSIFTTRADRGGAVTNFDPGLSHYDFSTPASAPSLRLTSTNDPVVAWQESVASSVGVFVAAWTGSAWTEFGAGPDVRGGATPSASPSLVLTRTGAPMVAFNEVDASTGASDIFVSRWNGSAWMVQGAALSNAAGATPAGFPSLALTSADAPVVAWVEPLAPGADATVVVRRFDGASWYPLGGSFSGDPAASTWAHSPCLVLDTSDSPYVAIAEGTHVFVFHYEGTNWVPVSEGFNERSANLAPIGDVSMVLDSRGTPVVAWDQQSSGGDSSVYVRRLNR